MNRDSIVALSEVLKLNTTLSELDLRSEKKKGEINFSIIMVIVVGNKQTGNGIKTSEIETLCDMLRINQTITTLCLNGKKNKKKSINQTIIMFFWCDFIGNQTEDEGTKKLSEMMKVNTTMKTLDLSGNERCFYTNKQQQEYELLGLDNRE